MIINIFRKLSHYHRATLLGLLVMMAIFLYLCVCQEFLLHDWFYDLILIPGLIGTGISAATYLARPFDKDTQSREKWATILALCVAIVIATLLVLKLSSHIPAFRPLMLLEDCLFAAGYISSFAGLANRAAQFSVINCHHGRPQLERRVMRISFVLGLIVGILVAVFATVAMNGMLSSASFFLPGSSILLIPVVGNVLTAVGITSTFTSAGDYLSKGINFWRYWAGWLKKDDSLHQHIASHYHEYRGAFVGTLVALACMIIICSCLPHLGAGILGVGVIGIVATGCCSLIGGLFSRIGKLIDGITEKDSTKQENMEQQGLLQRSAPIMSQKSKTPLYNQNDLVQDPRKSVRSDTNSQTNLEYETQQVYEDLNKPAFFEYTGLFFSPHVENKTVTEGKYCGIPTFYHS